MDESDNNETRDKYSWRRKSEWGQKAEFNFEEFLQERLSSISPEHAIDPNDPKEIKPGLEDQEIKNKLGRIAFRSEMMSPDQIKESIKAIDQLVPNQRESIKKGMEENKPVFGAHLSIFEKEGGEAK